MDILDTFRLDGRVVLVTGASSGLGVRFATAFAEAGADIAIVARRADRLAQTAHAVTATGRRVLPVVADVADPNAASDIVDQVVAGLGRVDVLVNNAGVSSARPATRETPDEFRRVIDVNLNGCYWVAQACGKVMTPGSSIINISSMLALTTAGLPQAAYSASKAGMLGLTRDLAAQWSGRKGIRVNAVAPGFFESEMTAEYDDGYLENALRTRVLLGRAGGLDELAGTLVWLASPAGGYVTGQTIVVDGGVSIT